MSQSVPHEQRILDLADRKRRGVLDGAAIAKLQRDGEITKSERRAIVKLASKPVVEKSSRQLLREEVKQKKAQPRERLTYEQRREKFTNVGTETEKRLAEAANFTVCLGCRKRGHFFKDCPKNPNSGNNATNTRGSAAIDFNASNDTAGVMQLICYNCGSTEHALRACEKPKSKDGTLPFASCFICKQKGHISRDCPSNANGIYAKGGSCHVCGSKAHLARNCPERSEEDKARWLEQQAAQAQEKEDRELGPRVAGISSKEEGGGGDALYGADTGVAGSDSDDGGENEEVGRKRKAKKDKKSSKKRKS